MKQETKELIKWIKNSIVQPSKGDEFYEKWKEAMRLLENSLPEIEKRLCLGGYIQDKNGTPCCHGDKVKFKFSEKGFNDNWKDKYSIVTTGELQWSTDTNSFAIIFGPNKNGYDWIDWTDLDYGPEWFEKIEKWFMSTRCQISILKEDNTILSCYCHYDGCVHSGVGEDLFNNYNSPELALKAVETCCDSMTKEEIETTDLYTYNNITELEDWIANTDREYLYLWKNDNWYVLPVKWKWVNRNWVLLSDALKDENFDKQSVYD